MKTTFTGKRITGVLTILPEQEYIYEDEIAKEPEENRRLKRLKRIMGYGKRRRAKETTTVSDMILMEPKNLFRKEKQKRRDWGHCCSHTLSGLFLPYCQCDCPGRIGTNG